MMVSAKPETLVFLLLTQPIISYKTYCSRLGNSVILSLMANIVAKKLTGLVDLAYKTMGGTPAGSSKKRKARADSSSSSSSGSDGGDSSSDESDVPVQMKPARPPAVSAAVLREQLRLDVPDFSLGDNGTEFDSDRYELWSVRLPALTNIQDLDGCEMMIPETASASVAGGTVAAPAAENGKVAPNNQPFSFATTKGDNYTLRWGQKVENESFRVLLQQKGDDSDDDDEEESNESNKKKKFLSPANAPFQRHVNVVSALEDVSETKLAPGTLTAPKPDLVTRGVQHKMRRAYQHVPQKTGLKRRWMPLGSKGGAEVVQKESRPRSLSASSILLETHQKRKRSMSGQNMNGHPPLAVTSMKAAPADKQGVGSSSGDDASKEAESKAEKKARKAAKKAAKKEKKVKKEKKTKKKD